MMSFIYVPDRPQLICHKVSQSYGESKYVELTDIFWEYGNIKGIQEIWIWYCVIIICLVLQ